MLGTPAYMSPEQARGNRSISAPTFGRSAVCSSRCLRGRGPSRARIISDTLANVLKSQPDWSALPPSVPPRIRTFVRRCLEKDRSRRVADASTVAYITEEALAPTSDAGGHIARHHTDRRNPAVGDATFIDRVRGDTGRRYCGLVVSDIRCRRRYHAFCHLDL